MRKLLVVFLGLVLLSGCGNIDDESTQDVADRRVHRVVVDGQECMVLTQAGGKIIFLDCDWSDR